MLFPRGANGGGSGADSDFSPFKWAVCESVHLRKLLIAASDSLSALSLTFVSRDSPSSLVFEKEMTSRAANIQNGTRVQARSDYGDSATHKRFTQHAIRLDSLVLIAHLIVSTWRQELWNQRNLVQWRGRAECIDYRLILLWKPVLHRVPLVGQLHRRRIQCRLRCKPRLFSSMPPRGYQATSARGASGRSAVDQWGSFPSCAQRSAV